MPSIAGFETRHPACDVLGTHRHGDAYAALVLDGSHVEASPDGPIACEPGMLVLHPRWHAHGNRFGRLGAKVANLELADDDAPDELCVLRVPDAREAQAVFARAPERLGELIVACEPVAAPVLHAWQADYLRELRDGELDLSTLARRAGVSAAHASRVFAASHGMAPQLLRRELRCRRALRLLTGDLPMADVAALTGFADQAHLGRTLRAATGATPSQLRRKIKCVQDRSAALRLQ